MTAHLDVNVVGVAIAVVAITATVLVIGGSCGGKGGSAMVVIIPHHSPLHLPTITPYHIIIQHTTLVLV